MSCDEDDEDDDSEEAMMHSCCDYCCYTGSPGEAALEAPRARPRVCARKGERASLPQCVLPLPLLSHRTIGC